MTKKHMNWSKTRLAIVSGLAILLNLGVVAANDEAALTFPDPQKDFSQYVEKSWTYLSNNSLPNRTPAGIRLNMPFEQAANPAVPYKGKFLLIHGLNDSPYVWHDVALQLTIRGFDVRAILLPGHGTSPANMLDVTYRQWLKAARRHYDFWNVDDTPFFLGGFSLGGVIATILSLENDNLNGLFLFSPAYHSRLNHLLRWSSLYSKFKPWLFGGMILEDNPVKYNSIPINSGAQYYKTTRYLKNRWRNKRIKLPTLIVVSENDSVVDIDYVRNLFAKRFIADKKSLIIYSADPNLELREREQLRNSAFPERRIINQAHLSLMNAPDNPIYGIKGLLICNGNEYPIFMACMRSRKHWFGAQHTPSPDGVAVARTTINPDFGFIFREFDQIFLN